MTRPAARDPAALEPGPRATLRQSELELGEVPPSLGALAHAPDALDGVWGLVERVLLKGRVPRTTKELALLAAASEAGLEPLAASLARGLAARGLDPLVLADVSRRAGSSRLPERTRRILAFARRAAFEPEGLEDADFQALRREGLADAELAELCAVGGAIACVVACARSLGATTE